MQRRALLKGLMMGGMGATLHVTSPSLARALAGDFGGASSAANDALDEAQRKLCAVLAELVIPTTDTPGAIAAGVPSFVEMMVCDWYTATERKIFLDGLAALNSDCLQEYSAGFLKVSEENQIEALRRQEDIASTYQPPESDLSFLMSQEDENAPFFDKLKELVVIGYYRSEIGAKQELIYNPMPMEYRDIPFTEVGRQWSS
ncbi:MAG: gluconate 2-dehydrogenase subunit 3 family protein [Halioglobus sp.]